MMNQKAMSLVMLMFGNDNPIRIEIGMGKGKFITTLAQQNPDINYRGWYQPENSL